MKLLTSIKTAALSCALALCVTNANAQLFSDSTSNTKKEEKALPFLRSSQFAGVMANNPSLGLNQAQVLTYMTAIHDQEYLVIDPLNLGGFISYNAFGGTLLGKVQTTPAGTANLSGTLSEFTFGYATGVFAGGVSFIANDSSYYVENQAVDPTTTSDQTVSLPNEKIAGHFSMDMGSMVVYANGGLETIQRSVNDAENEDANITDDRLFVTAGAKLTFDKASNHALDASFTFNSFEQTAGNTTGAADRIEYFINANYGKILKQNDAFKLYGGANGALGFISFSDIDDSDTFAGEIARADFSGYVIQIIPNIGFEYMLTSKFGLFGAVQHIFNLNSVGGDFLDVNNEVAQSISVSTWSTSDNSSTEMITGINYQYKLFTAEAGLQASFYNQGTGALFTSNNFAFFNLIFNLGAI